MVWAGHQQATVQWVGAICRPACKSCLPNQTSYPSHCMRWKYSKGVNPNSAFCFILAKSSSRGCWKKGRLQMFSEILEKDLDQIHRVRKCLYP